MRLPVGRRLAAAVFAAMVAIAPDLASLAAPAGDRAKDLTVPLIYGGDLDTRPPSGFKWSRDGARVAFVRPAADGQPPVLDVYDVAKARSIPLTSAGDGLGKLKVSRWSWSPAGDALLAEADGDLYLLDPGGDAPPRRLTETPAAERDAAWAPDGSSIAFVRDGDLWRIDPATRREVRLTSGGSEDVLNGAVDWVYEEEFGLRTAWWWSPDSARIAFLQFDQTGVPRYPIVDWIPTHPEVTWQRYPKAGDANATVRLGIVRSDGTAPPRWIDVGGSPDVYIPRVSWTADGRSVAVQRMNRDQTSLEVILCDPGSGAVSTILTETDPHWVNVGDDWAFLESGGGRFIWGSERDGFRHLYLYGLDGKLVRRLTRGNWAVSDLSAVDEKSGWIYFTASETARSRRNLYRVRLDGSGFARLTPDEGWHDVAVSDATGAFIDVASTVATPPRVTLRDAGGATRATLDAGDASAIEGYPRGRVEFLTVPASDGTPLPAMMTLPPDFDPNRRYPVIVYVYGGPHAQLVRDEWTGRRGLWHAMLAARGYIVWILDNRGAGNYGHAWETPIYRRLARQELADQIDGVAWLKGRPWVDASRIGIWGWSYGGYMTLYAMFNAPGTFKAGVAIAPVTDWKDYDTIYTERYMDRPQDNPDGYRDSSPVTRASALEGALLLVHGSADDNVHMQNSVQLLDALVEAGKPVEFMLYPGRNHGIPGRAAQVHLFEKITDFLMSRL